MFIGEIRITKLTFELPDPVPILIFSLAYNAPKFLELRTNNVRNKKVYFIILFCVDLF